MTKSFSSGAEPGRRCGSTFEALTESSQAERSSRSSRDDSDREHLGIERTTWIFSLFEPRTDNELNENVPAAKWRPEQATILAVPVSTTDSPTLPQSPLA